MAKYREHNYGIEYFKYYYNSNQTLWFENYNFNGANIVMLNRIKTNHYNLTTPLARVNFINDSMCTCRLAEQDIDHVLSQCPLDDRQRTKLVKI